MCFRNQRFFFCLLILLLTACGEITELSLGDGSLNTPVDNIYIYGTDFQSAGQLFEAQGLNLVNLGLTHLGSSASVKFFNNRVYILHDGASVGSSDNVQVLNPQNNFVTTAQYSTGNGSNPTDMVVVNGLAYISLYSPELSSSSRTTEGHPSDVIVMDLSNGDIVKRYSFASYLHDDDYQTARASQMVLVNNLLYVCLQDLGADAGNWFLPNSFGKLAIIDTATNTLVDVITLKGHNPVDIAYSPNSNRLYIAHMAPLNSVSKINDTSSDYGGIESLNLADVTDSILMADDALGGYVERLAVSDDSVFSVVSNFNSFTGEFKSQVMQMSLRATSAASATSFVNPNSDIREIIVDAQNKLWVARRTIFQGDGEVSNPQLDVYDASSGIKERSLIIPLNSENFSITSIAIE